MKNMYRILIAGLLFATSAFGADLTDEQYEAVDLLHSLESTDFEAYGEGTLLLDSDSDSDGQFVDKIEFYDKVKSKFEFRVKNNTGSSQLEIGAIDCVFKYKTRLGEDRSEEVAKKFTGVVSGGTATLQGTQRLCTRQFTCRYVVHVVGCTDDECYRAFGPKSFDLNARPEGRNMCMIFAKLKVDR